MSAANDGAETDSTRIAVASSLSFIAVPMFPPLIPERVISLTFRLRPDLAADPPQSSPAGARAIAPGWLDRAGSGPRRTQDVSDRPRRHRLPTGDKMPLQAIHGAFPDQEIDQRQPPRLVHRFDQQFPIAIEIVFRHLIHPPRPATAARSVSQGRNRSNSETSGFPRLADDRVGLPIMRSANIVIPGA